MISCSKGLSITGCKNLMITCQVKCQPLAGNLFKNLSKRWLICYSVYNFFFPSSPHKRWGQVQWKEKKWLFKENYRISLCCTVFWFLFKYWAGRPMDSPLGSTSHFKRSLSKLWDPFTIYCIFKEQRKGSRSVSHLLENVKWRRNGGENLLQENRHLCPCFVTSVLSRSYRTDLA